MANTDPATLAAVCIGPMDSEVVGLEARLRAAQLQADVDALAALLSDDLLFTGPDGQLAGKTDDLAAHRSGAVRFRAHEPQELRVRRQGDWVALTALRARLEVEVGGNRVEGSYRFTRVWAKEADGVWRVIGGQVNALPQEAE